MVNYKIQDRKILYLNTEANCSKLESSDTTKNLEFTWNVPSIKIDDLAHLSVVSIHFDGTGDNNHPLTFRIKDIQFNSRSYYSSDNISSPIIFAGNTVAGFLNKDDIAITLTPQIINSITIMATDDLSNPFSGIATTLQFIICLSIDEFDVKLTQYGNPYGEARVDNLNNKLY